MDRRDFFKAALGLLGAATLPGVSLVAPQEEFGKFVSIDALRRAADSLRASALGEWYIFVHPDMYQDIIRITAREAWKREYRRARMELKKMLKDALAQGGIGHIEDFRFIVSDKMPV